MAAPFAFSLQPPTLVLSNCAGEATPAVQGSAPPAQGKLSLSAELAAAQKPVASP
jgi:hypothetical protein